MHGIPFLSSFIPFGSSRACILLLILAISGFSKGRAVSKGKVESRSDREARKDAVKRPSESNKRSISKKIEAPRIEKKSEPRRPKPDFNEAAPGKKEPVKPQKPPEKPPEKPSEKPNQEPPRPPTWTKPFKPGF